MKAVSRFMRRGFTGWHMAGTLVAFFGVVMAVNFTMASFATSTFGGIVVENSYVASQEFNGWLEQAEQSENLGWQANSKIGADGHVSVTLAGAPDGAQLNGMARHPVGQMDDILLSFAAVGGGKFLSTETLPAGRWILRLEAGSGGDIWRSEANLR